MNLGIAILASNSGYFMDGMRGFSWGSHLRYAWQYPIVAALVTTTLLWAAGGSHG